MPLSVEQVAAIVPEEATDKFVRALRAAAKKKGYDSRDLTDEQAAEIHTIATGGKS